MCLRICLVILLIHWGKVSVLAQPASSAAQSVPQSIGLQVGTTGPGIIYNRLLNAKRRLSLRVGGQYIAYQKLIRIKAKTDSYIDVDPDFAIAIAQASLKWHPFRTGTFFLTGGLGYTWHPNLSTVITTENKLKLDELVLTPEDVGTVNLGVRWKPVIGYLGWGFGRSIPKRRLGASVEMGVHYLGKPRLESNYEGFLETTTLDQQLPIIERNISGYRYLLSINLLLSYRLTKK